ncbi:YqjF family protein [Georgenia alba]|uniref:YqjF family protein n=1 Tax=Georgenia alba TaxID=2233858 RepID=A0ABW2Q3W9_9MICO
MSGRRPDRPVRAAVSHQRWDHVVFLHWPVAPPVLSPLLPPGLVLDVVEGAAWVTVTPLRMQVRPAFGPAVPHLSHFPEVNVRTYVRAPDGSDGLWFLSLECPRLPVVAALRAVGLPYRFAQPRILAGTDRVRVLSHRGRGAAGMRADVTLGAPLSPDPLTDFLTGRWAAYTRRLGRLWRVGVEHEPWPLRRAQARVDVGALLAADGLPGVGGDPLVHYSPGVRARIGLPSPAG